MRSFTSTVKTLLAALGIPAIVVLVEFETLGVRLTNWKRDVTFGGATYTAASLAARALGENLLFEAPNAELEIASLDATQQARFFADSFRGDVCTVTLLYVDSAGDMQSSGWATSYACDAETCNDERVTVRLVSMDAVEGTEVPRRTTQEHGCQHDFQRGECTFRWRQGLNVKLKECDKGYDTPNGCKAHFPDVVDPGDPTGATKVPQPKPYGAFLGGIDHQLVLSGRR